jgi:hypothetical protein
MTRWPRRPKQVARSKRNTLYSRHNPPHSSLTLIQHRCIQTNSPHQVGYVDVGFDISESGAVDGDVAGGRARSQGEVRLTRLRLGRRLQADPDVSGHGVEVEPRGQVVGYADC